MTRKAVVHHRMQRGCVYWCTEPVGRNFAPGFTPQDPRGGDCRYYMGRRTADDARQIRCWRAIGRHVAAIQKNCEPGDLECRRKQRQAVLHWAYDSRRIERPHVSPDDRMATS